MPPSGSGCAIWPTSIAAWPKRRGCSEPGSRLVILEFTTPPRQPLRALYFFYFRRMLPFIGRLVSRHSDAYTYLPESVLAFPEPEALAGRMRDQGFHDVNYERLLGGICAIHVGTRG